MFPSSENSIEIHIFHSPTPYPWNTLNWFLIDQIHLILFVFWNKLNPKGVEAKYPIFDLR